MEKQRTQLRDRTKVTGMFQTAQAITRGERSIGSKKSSLTGRQGKGKTSSLAPWKNQKESSAVRETSQLASLPLNTSIPASDNGDPQVILASSDAHPIHTEKKVYMDKETFQKEMSIAKQRLNSNDFMKISQQEEVDESNQYNIENLTKMGIDDLESQKLKTSITGNEAIQFFS